MVPEAAQHVLVLYQSQSDVPRITTSSTTMHSSDSKYTDARYSCFNDVGRDSHQTHNNITIHHQSIHMHLSLLGSQQTSRHDPIDLDDNLRQPISSPKRDKARDNTFISKIVHALMPLFPSQQASHQVPATLPR